jgi:ubiquinone/menaquinone biosynthesis C-methylase UbiE
MESDSRVRGGYLAAQRISLPGKGVLAEAVAASLAAPSDGRILLVPADVGQFAGPLFRVVPGGTVFAVDLHATAAGLYRTRTNTETPVSVADMHRLPFASRTFHAVVSVLALHLTDSCETLLREWRRVTRPGGQVALATMTDEQVRRHPMAHLPQDRHFPSRDALVGRLLDTGWCDVRAQEVLYSSSLALSDIPIAFAQSANSFLFRQSKRSLASLHRAIRNQSDDGRTVSLQFAWTVLTGRRRIL